MPSGYNYQGGPFASTTPNFTLYGGTYGVTYSGGWGGGSVTLNVLSNDGVTWLPALAAFSANGTTNAILPGGTYQLAVLSTAASTYVSISRIPRQ